MQQSVYGAFPLSVWIRNGCLCYQIMAWYWIAGPNCGLPQQSLTSGWNGCWHTNYILSVKSLAYNYTVRHYLTIKYLFQYRFIYLNDHRMSSPNCCSSKWAMFNCFVSEGKANMKKAMELMKRSGKFPKRKCFKRDHSPEYI